MTLDRSREARRRAALIPQQRTCGDRFYFSAKPFYSISSPRPFVPTPDVTIMP